MADESILVVEDDAALLEGLRDILELAGYRVTTAANGAEALAALAKNIPHLIVSDITMPRMDGYQLYQKVRERPEWVSVPFIFLTAQGEKAAIRRGKELGVDDYITKPFDEEDLLIAVRAKLQRSAQLDAARNAQLSDLKRSILTILNHEFRTPLTYITGYTEILTESGPALGSAEFKGFLRGIQTGSDRLRGLIEDFLLLAEIQTGEARETYERRREKVENLPALLRRVMMDFAQKAAARNVRLNAEISESLPSVLADREFLSTAVGRLVDNGIKFSKKDGGQVTLQAQAEGGCIAIRVTDDGVGIRSEELGRLFDVFVQIDRAKMEQQGSGSGLAIARGVVQLHGGTLTVQSEYGVGSTFTIELPVLSA